MISTILLLSFPVLTNLSGPDGLYSSENGIYICEETAGKILFFNEDSVVFLDVPGLQSPEGICVTQEGKILVVEDTPSGRLLEFNQGVLTVLADDLCCPEGITEDADGTVWFTTGGFEGGSVFTSLWRLEPGSTAERVYSLPSLFSFSDVEAADDGMVYICSESSGILGDVSVFRYNPDSGVLMPFVTGIPACEGIGTTGGCFPFYITEENGAVHKVDSMGTHTIFADSLSSVEDVAVYKGEVFVTEDGTGNLLRLETE